jgi:hypothetical protein
MILRRDLRTYYVGVLGRFLVEDRSPPPSSNPPPGALDAASMTAVEIIRARALQLSQITYTTMLDGVASGPITCAPSQRCEVRLPASCGAKSSEAATACGGRTAVSCQWSVTATETVPNNDYIIPSEPVVLGFALSFPAIASCPTLYPRPEPLVERQAVGREPPLIVDYAHEQPVQITCPTDGTYPRFRIGASAAVGRSSPRVPATGRISVSPGLHVVHARCESDDDHILPSSVTEGSFYVLQVTSRVKLKMQNRENVY